MPALTRQVSRSNSRRVRRRPNPRFRGSSARVPRAISTRGTPNGYYEIPVRSLLKIYYSSTNGFIPCNQTTGAPTAVGFNGIGIYTQLDTLTCFFGNGGINGQTDVDIAGYPEMARVFDQCKIASMSIDVWFENNLRTNDNSNQNTAYGMSDVYLTQDKDGVTPPASLDEILQYAKVQRMPAWGGKTYKNKCYPYVRDVMGTSGDEFGTNTTVAGSTPSGYINTSKPAVAHLGWKAYMDKNSASTNFNGIINICVTQVRRYKNTK